MITDGRVAMTYEEALAKCRFYDAIPASDTARPPYIAVCDIARWTADTCEIRGFKGRVTRRHIRLLIQILLDRGFQLVYLERPDGQELDHMASRVVGGDFDGWYRLDLHDMAKKLRIDDGAATA